LHGYNSMRRVNALAGRQLVDPRQNRLKSSNWGRLVLGLLLLSWVSASAQPCLMAAEMTPDATLAAGHSDHGEHAQHDANPGSGHGCAHCPPGGNHNGGPCASGLNADCGGIPDYRPDGRSAKFKLDGKFVPVAVVPAVPPDAFAAADGAPSACSRPGQLRFAAGPTLSIRYCVFLK